MLGSALAHLWYRARRSGRQTPSRIPLRLTALSPAQGRRHITPPTWRLPTPGYNRAVMDGTPRHDFLGSPRKQRVHYLLPVNSLVNRLAHFAGIFVQTDEGASFEFIRLVAAVMLAAEEPAILDCRQDAIPYFHASLCGRHIKVSGEGSNLDFPCQQPRQAGSLLAATQNLISSNSGVTRQWFSTRSATMALSASRSRNCHGPVPII